MWVIFGSSHILYFPYDPEIKLSLQKNTSPSALNGSRFPFGIRYVCSRFTFRPFYKKLITIRILINNQITSSISNAGKCIRFHSPI